MRFPCRRRHDWRFDALRFSVCINGKGLKMIRYLTTLTLAVALWGCASGGEGILPEGATEIEENRVNRYVAPDGSRFNMRTYRTPLNEFFYVTVKPADRMLAFDQMRRSAGSAAAQYISSRGCEGQLSRLTSRDLYDAASNSWTIVIAC